MNYKPELLLPVGSFEMCLAAIHYGADAIYVGVPGFNARGRAKDHSIDELKEMINQCHLYGVKVYLAFNVLIFEDELEKARDILKEVIPLGVDAFIVQDLGLIQMIKQMNPNQIVHGSTQMTVTNDEAIHFLEDLDIKRFVLGRENSLKEIELIKNKTERELEVFVHGALCVAYSGQCFTSESLGGRSANRGQCAQSCRLSYDLIVDGVKKDLGDKKYLVSPQDLCGISQIDELKRIGVHSLKVEGRLKGANYVASTAYHYQKAINGELDLAIAKAEMGEVYSRGFFPGWMDGVNHQELVPATHSSHIGHPIGEIIGVSSQGIKITSNMSLMAGMGLSFLNGSDIVGAKIFKIISAMDDIYQIELFNFDLSKLKTGLRVFLNSHDTKKSEWEDGFTQEKKFKKIKISLSIEAIIGEKLLVTVKDDHHEIFVESSIHVEQSKSGDGVLVAKTELSSLGGTPFIVDEFSFKGESSFFIPKSELKKIRRQFTEKLMQQRVNVTPVTLNEVIFNSHKNPSNKKTRLNILLRTMEQVRALLSIDDQNLVIDKIFLDFEFGKDYSEAISLLKSSGFYVFIATTRILKPNEYYNLNTLLRSEADGFLVRNLGAFEYLKKRTNKPLWGDFSLNAANSFSVDYLLKKGLRGINLSYDLNSEQLKSLIVNTDADQLEVTTYQYMPEFHMEHCVFAAFLSNGKSFKDCGKPCEKHEVEMIDSYGNHHFLKADHECRNTMYRGTSQSAVELVDDLKRMQVGNIRFEALSENEDQLVVKIKALLDYLNEKSSLAQLTKQLGSSEKYGLSSGQLFKKDSYKDIKKVGIDL